MFWLKVWQGDEVQWGGQNGVDDLVELGFGLFEVVLLSEDEFLVFVLQALE